MKSSTKKLLVVLNRTAKVAGFETWGSLIAAAQKDERVLAVATTNPTLVQSFLWGLRIAFGAPVPTAATEKIDAVRAVLAKIPTDAEALTGAIEKLTEDERLELLSEATIAFAKAREALRETSHLLPTGLPGRPPIEERVRDKIVAEVKRLCSEKHLTRSDAVKEVSNAHGISERTIWKLLLQQSTDSVISEATANEAARTLATGSQTDAKIQHPDLSDSALPNKSRKDKPSGPGTKNV